eukprot:COSAG06_NODE_26539_length_612_cov_1.315789_1_plen_130_part_10
MFLPERAPYPAGDWMPSRRSSSSAGSWQKGWRPFSGEPQSSSFVTRSLEMEADLERIMELLEEHDIDLRVRWIPSAEMPADYFSREADKADWSLRRSVIAPLLCVFDTREANCAGAAEDSRLGSTSRCGL